MSPDPRARFFQLFIGLIFTAGIAAGVLLDAIHRWVRS